MRIEQVESLRAEVARLRTAARGESVAVLDVLARHEVSAGIGVGDAASPAGDVTGGGM